MQLFFIPSSSGGSSSTRGERFFTPLAETAYGGYLTMQFTAGVSFSGNFSFAIPDDFGSIITIEAVVTATGADALAADIDLASDYAKIDEPTGTHSEVDTTSPDILQDVWSRVDLAGVFTDLEAGDYCGVTITHNNVAVNCFYLYIHLVYNKA